MCRCNVESETERKPLAAEPFHLSQFPCKLGILQPPLWLNHCARTPTSNVSQWEKFTHNVIADATRSPQQHYSFTSGTFSDLFVLFIFPPCWQMSLLITAKTDDSILRVRRVLISSLDCQMSDAKALEWSMREYLDFKGSCSTLELILSAILRFTRQLHRFAQLTPWTLD